jgi:exosortase
MMEKPRLHSVQHASLLCSIAELALPIKVSVIVIAVVALYFQDLYMLFTDALNSEVTSHVLAIPIIFGYLLYRKRKMLSAAIPSQNQNQPRNSGRMATLSGILLCVMSVILYYYGSRTFTPLEFHILTLPTFAAGLTLIMFNPQILRQALFPILFLFLLVPPPSEILYGLASILSVVSSEASKAIVSAIGVPSTISAEFGTPTIVVTRPDGSIMNFSVDPACSGIYSLIGFLIFAVFIAYIIRDKAWKKLSIFMLGLPLIYLLNIVRITTIVLIGYQYGEQLALDVFHLFGGWILIFLGTLILLVVAEKLFKTHLFTKLPQQFCPECNPHTKQPQTFCSHCGRLLRHSKTRLRKTDIGKIAAISSVVIILVWAQSPIFALTQGPAQVIVETMSGEQGNTQLLPLIHGYTLDFMVRDTEFEQIARQDVSLLFLYTPQNQTQHAVWVAVEIAQAISSLHRWEYCLVIIPQIRGYSTNINQLDLRDTQILQDPPIIARYFAFENTRYNSTQVVLYWYETSMLSVNNSTEQRHVKLSLIAYPETPQDVSAAESELSPIATAIAGHWQPIKTWSQIAVFLSQGGTSFAGLAAALLTATVVVQDIETRRERKLSVKAYQKLSRANRHAVDAVRATEKASFPTLEAIRTTYKELAGHSITTEELQQELSELEKTGILRSSIVNRYDEPFRVWKTQVGPELETDMSRN